MNRHSGRIRVRRWPILLGALVAAAPVTNRLELQLIAFGVFAAILAEALARGALRTITATEMWVTAFAAYAILSLLWGHRLSHAKPAIVFIEYAGTALMYISVYRSCHTAERWRAVGYCYLAGSMVGVLLVVWGWYTGTFFEEEGRYSIEGVNGNFTAYSLATAVPVVMALFWSERAQGVRKVAVGTLCMLSLGFAIALTGCRGASIAFLCVAAMCAVRLLTVRPFAGVVAVGVVAAAGVAYSSTVADVLPARLFMGPSGLEDVTTGRMSLWEQAVRVFRENPVFGSGADSYQWLSTEGVHAHNVFLSVLAEMGIVGVALLTVLLFTLWRGYFRINASASSKWAAAALVVTWCVIAATGVWQYALPAWITFAWMARTPRYVDAAPHAQAAM
jgi:putative inorganic carbon (hco3(-)) transporter